MPDTAALLEQISQLYGQGQYLTALEISQPLGPLPRWPGTDGQVLAGRLANNLGAMRLARTLHLAAYRRDPAHWEARYFFIWARFARRGPLLALEWMDRLGEPPDDSPRTLADWLGLKAHTLAVLRDFESADALIDRALRVAPQRPWVWVEKSSVLEMEDRHDEAIEAARRALELRPFYRPAVQAAAHALVQRNRDEEAMALLQQAIERLQSGDVIAQLAALQTELHLYAEARANFDRLEQFFPLMHYDKHRLKWLAARRADAAYYCGDLDEAVRLAQQADSPFHKQLIERLSQRPLAGRRHELPVPFVRQHHNTCGPATLSSITQFWRQPVDHLEVVEKICYDGTPAHSERGWAEDNGFIAREFTVTWKSAKALLDLGLPFTLTTVDPGNAHLQAVHGYDEPRGSFLVRDPGERHTAEFLAEKMLEHYAPCGPRGMVVVPRAWLDGAADCDAQRAVPGGAAGRQQEDATADPRIGAASGVLDRPRFLESFRQIQLQDAELYDHYYRVELALQKHQRDAARQELARMLERDPDHRLTIHARRTIAAYDADEPAMLTCAERLLKLYPKDVNLLMMKLGLLTQIGRRDDRLAMLEEICARPDADPFFWQALANELSADARQYDKVYQLVRRSMRYRPVDERGMSLMADVLWSQPALRGDALRLYRFAACLGERDEGRAKSYFIASRHLKRTGEVLRFLEDRFRRFGHRKGWSAQTLAWAYEILDRAADAFATIERALALRPDDSELLLYAADFFSRFGRRERAEPLLERARDISHRTAWLRTAAGIELHQGKLRDALDLWKQVLAAEPLARDANHMVAQLTADVEGIPAALAHLRGVVAKYPHSYALRTLLLEWESNEGPENSERACREMLELWPVDAYARRELAIALVRQRKWDEAWEETQLACDLDPHHPLCRFLMGKIHAAHGRIAEAKAAFRDSIRTSIDYDPAIAALVEICDTQAEREEELEFIHGQLVEQVTFGEGLLSCREYAGRTWPPEKLLQRLRQAHAARPDLWQAHSALMMQLLDMERLDEALEVAREAATRFPLLPRTWVDLAIVHRARRDDASEVEALQKALDISPWFGEPRRQLAEALLRQKKFDEAKSIIEKGIAYEPRDVVNYGTLADVQWTMGQRDEAIETARKALLTQPGYEYALNRLREWTRETGRPEIVIELMRELARTRPNEPRSWLMLAESLTGTEHYDECLAAFDRAIELNPRNADAYSTKAWNLAQAGDFDAALAACKPPIFGDEPPLQLRARAAEIFAMRGDRAAAIAAMDAVVQGDPNYYWAWMKLAEWHQQSDNQQEFLRCAGEMTRIAPRYPPAWMYSGDARLRSEDRAGAKRDYAKAHGMDPAYNPASLTLLDLHWEDNELDEMQQVFATSHEHLPPEYRLANQVRLDMAGGHAQAAADHLRQLCACPLQDEDALRMAAGAMWDRDAQAQVFQVLHDCWHREDAAPPVATLWAQAGGLLGRLPEVGGMLGIRDPGTPQWRAGARRYMTELGRVGELQRLKSFTRNYRRSIEADDETWAEAGDALFQAGDAAAAIAWLEGWRDRPSPSASMAFPLVLSQWQTGRVEDMLSTAATAAALAPDATTQLHQLFLAIGRGVRGEGAAAAAALEHVNAQALADAYVPLHQTISTLLTLTLPGDNSSDRLSYSMAKRCLASAAAPLVEAARNKDKIAARLLHLARAALAAHYGKRLAAWWHRWRAGQQA